jgi:hypothetical protein
MTIDEFKAVVAISGLRVYVWKDAWLLAHNPPIRRYTAALVKGEGDCEKLEILNQVVAEFTGHTKKSALKKLKDWYHYEGRKNGNR